MTLLEFVRSEDRLKAYDEWVSSPMTRELLRMAKHMFGPLGLPIDQRTGEKALYYAGTMDGAGAALDLIGDIRAFVENQKQLAAAQGLVPDYGAQELMKQSADGQPVEEER